MLSAASNWRLGQCRAVVRVAGRNQAERDRAQPARALGARADRSSPVDAVGRSARARVARHELGPIARREALSRSAWIASGSTTSIRSPIRLSLGSSIASPLNAGSSALDRSVAADRRDHRLRIARPRRARRRSALAASAPASPRSGRTDRCRLRRAARARPAARSTSTHHRRREIAVDRQHRRLGDVLEDGTLCRGLVEQDQPLVRDARAAVARRTARS